MKKVLLASASLLAFGAFASASAADLAARPYTKAPVAVASVYNWTGFYLGIVGGGAWENASGDPKMKDLFRTAMEIILREMPIVPLVQTAPKP